MTSAKMLRSAISSGSKGKEVLAVLRIQVEELHREVVLGEEEEREP